jgi:hypothetical protein
MYDEYVPVPDLRCPKCDVVMTGWQGYDGPRLLLRWQQGEAEPVDHPVDEDWRLPDDQIRAFRLPRSFLIYGGECGCSAAFAALCETDEAQRWTSTRLVTKDEARAFRNPCWNT